MNILTIVGTRPELIRLSLIIPKLDLAATRHVLVHTGQNYDRTLRDIFFEEMGIRLPDYAISLQAHTFGAQLGQMLAEVEAILDAERPDRVLVLGDTNSALCAMLAERKGIPVYHMEAGNRCFDTAVPEEINRRMIDAVSSVNLPYTPVSREHLLREGMHPSRIWQSGNPIHEVLQHYRADITRSTVVERLGLRPGGYVAVTCHRAENVDRPQHLQQIAEGLKLVAEQTGLPLICSVHPRTEARLLQHGIDLKAANAGIRLHPPFGFFDFVALQQSAACVVTDSGTVQEESCLLHVPAVTIRRSTERTETVVCGSNVVSGLDAGRIAAGVRLMLASSRSWAFPDGYTDPDVSDKVVNMIIGGIGHV